jgi:hypothetical protein
MGEDAAFIFHQARRRIEIRSLCRTIPAREFSQVKIEVIDSHGSEEFRDGLAEPDPNGCTSIPDN